MSKDRGSFSPLSPFLSRFSNLIVENRTLKFVLVCISLIAVYQQYSINKYFDEQMVTIQPPNLRGEASIGRDYADDEYLTAMAIYVGNLFLNVGASNVSRQFADILKLAHPDSFNDLKSKLKERAALLEKYNSISYSATIQRNRSMIIEKTSISFFASKRKIVGGSIEKGIPYKIVIDYVIINGTFYINDIKEVEDV